MAKQKILIIRFSSIGDIILTSPIVRCTSQQLDCEVHFLTKESFASVVSHSPYVDKVYTIKDKVKEIILALKAEHYDIVIDLHKNLRSKSVSRALKAKRYTFDKLNWQKALYTSLKIDLLPEKHIVDRYFEGLKDLGIHNDGQGLDYFIPQEDREAVFSNHSLPSEYEVLVLGANYFTKRIPQSLASEIIQKAKLPIIILGGKDVVIEAESLQELHSESINLAGKIPLNQSAAIIEKAHTVHTGDTGLMHMAAGLKRKVVTYWGNTTPKLGMYAYLPESAPTPINYEVMDLSCRPCSKLGYNKCPKGHFKCMLDHKI